ncbi:MAG: prolyl oligopeptidase family serine peptidase [Acidimicrobiaceae bacterium]|nr:S9 family peptidase [Acidimicrobiia bacterium]MCY4495169.1 prolyl oligopeptidase family serine peptidase [Acidimicrobiaceae bacterium]
MNSAPVTGRGSFPRRHALTRGFTLGAPRNIRVSADGQRVVFLRSSGPTDPVNSLWLLDVAKGTERLVVDAAELGPEQAVQPAAERARRERARESAGGIVSYDVDRDLTVAVFAVGSQIVRVDLLSGEARVLDAAEGAFDPRLSPDTTKVAYVAGGELRVVTDTGDRLLIGEPDETVSWGSAEFIAAEEMGRTRGFWWGPDSDALLVQRVDVAPVGIWWISAPVYPQESPTQIRYPAAGSANADVALAIVGLNNSRVDVDWRHRQAPDAPGSAASVVPGDSGVLGGSAAPVLPGDSGVLGGSAAPGVPGDSSVLGGSAAPGVPGASDNLWEYLARADWTDDGILLTVQSRDQRSLGVLDVDPLTGECSQRYQVVDEHWVELVAGTPALHEGRLVTVEDRAPARRLCVDGAALTGDGVQVRSVIDAGGDGIVITACREPTSVQVATVGWNGELRWWDNSPGIKSAVIGGATEVRVNRGLSHHGAGVEVRHHGRAVSRIASRSEAPNVDLNISMHRLGDRELAAALLLPNEPSEADSEMRLPVLLDPYGGPHAQRVQQARSLFYVSQWFADQGFAVLVTDGRGTPGRGPTFEREVRGDLAGPVLDDQIDALKAMAELNPRLDLDRVAIRGWSFGGYLAALAVLRRPDVFHAAVAGAPVTDWRLYDTHYTERYLGHPETEPENYERCDVLFGAAEVDDAKGAAPLLLIHGLADDNVVAAHTLRLSRALLEAGRPHTVLPLSGVTHMTPQEEVAENLMHLQLNFLRNALSCASTVNDSTDRTCVN